VEGGAGELEGEFVEAFFQQSVDFLQGGLEVFGGGGFGAAGAARGAEQEVVGLDAGFEEVELAGGESDFGQPGGGEGAGECEQFGGFVVHEGIGEGFDFARVYVGFRFEDGVLMEHGVGAKGACGFEDLGGEGGAGLVFRLGDSGDVGRLDEGAGFGVGDLGEEAVVEWLPSGEAGGEGEAGILIAEGANG